MVSEGSLQERLLKYLLAPFGPKVSNVALHLLCLQGTPPHRLIINKHNNHNLGNRGGLTLGFLLVNSKLSARLVKDALKVLIHHNFIQANCCIAEDTEQGDTETIIVRYWLDFGNVLMRIGFPKVYWKVKEQFGERHAESLLDVFVRGRAIYNAEDLFHSDLIRMGYCCLVEKPPSNEMSSSPKRLRHDQKLATFIKVNLASVKHDALVHFCSQTFPEHSQIVERILGLSASEFTSLTVNQAYDALQRLFESVPWIKKLHHETFVLDRPALAKHLSFLLTLSYVNARYGPSSTRLFCILEDKQLSEERSVCKAAMMPVKEVRERLYEMLRDGFISLREIARSADHAPNRTTYLWYPKYDAHHNPLLSIYLHAMVNVAERAMQECSRHRLLLEKLAATKPEVQVSALEKALLPADVEEQKMMEKAQNRLSIYLQRLLSEYLVLLSCSSESSTAGE